MSRDLEIRHCRVLLAVKEHGGIAAAARALGLAQSTVSETLLSLERILGTPVTVRRPGGGATLTAAADALLPHAQALITASEAALVAVATKGQEIIRLGTVESISSFLLPRPLQAFRQRWSRVDVRISIGLCDDLRKRVQRSELDAAVTIEGAERAHNGEGGWSRVLSPARLKLVAAPHTSIAQGAVERAALASRTFLLADPDGAFNGLMRGWFADTARQPRFESAGSVDGVKRGVQSSDAIGVLPGYAVAEELASGALVELKVHEPLPAIALLVTAPEPPIEASPLHLLIDRIGEAVGQS
jgi:molybdate transport repressor ModE-like protein